MNSKGIPKIMIFGSCVTRDIFRICDDQEREFEIKEYVARQSIASSFDKPLRIAMDAIHLDSPFQQRLVYADLNKTLRKTLRRDYDFILVDFIDERFPLLRYKGHYYTESDEFRDSGLSEKYPFTQVASDEKDRLFLKALPKFVKQISKWLKAGRVILHKAVWVSEYYDAEGETCRFNEGWQAIIDNMNAMLNKYNEAFISLCKDVKVIEQERVIGDGAHLWGLSPIHYTNDYYQALYRQFKGYFSTL
jgi:hypothetical protein